jgi:hypothetical protein
VDPRDKQVKVRSSACSPLLADYALTLFLGLEDGYTTFPQNICKNQTALRHIPDDSSLHSHRYENRNSNFTLVCHVFSTTYLRRRIIYQ